MTGELEHRLRAVAAAGTSQAPTARQLPDIAAALERSGHADVTYAVEDSPVGQLLLAATDTGLLRLHYLREGYSLEQALGDISARLTPRIIASGTRLERTRRELDEFFAGRRRDFDLPLDWSLVQPGFRRSVLQSTAKIPFGQTVSYKVHRRPGRQRAGLSRCGHSTGLQPAPDRGPLSPRAALRRRPGWLHGRG